MTVVIEKSNLGAWESARTDGTSKTGAVRVIPTHAAEEILNDPRWADKIRRALADSDAGRVRPLSEHRQNL